MSVQRVVSDVLKRVLCERELELACGHKMKVSSEAPAPTTFECPYCEHVETIEEKQARVM